MSVNQPIVNAGLLYVNGLQLARTAASTMTVAAGAARDSTNVNDIVLSAPVTITSTTVGVNGVDVAIAVLNSFYAVYVIGDSTDNQPTAALLSLSATAPSLPFGYDMFRRVGYIKTDGSANILQFWQYGSGSGRNMYYDVGIAVTTTNVTSFTAVSLAAGVPPLVTRANLLLTYTAASAANSVQFLPYGSVATNGIVDFGCGVAAAQKGNVLVPTEINAGAASVLYKMVASDALTTAIVGYEDYL